LKCGCPVQILFGLLPDLSDSLPEPQTVSFGPFLSPYRRIPLHQAFPRHAPFPSCLQAQMFSASLKSSLPFALRLMTPISFQPLCCVFLLLCVLGRAFSSPFFSLCSIPFMFLCHTCFCTLAADALTWLNRLACFFFSKRPPPATTPLSIFTGEVPAYCIFPFLIFPLFPLFFSELDPPTAFPRFFFAPGLFFFYCARCLCLVYVFFYPFFPPWTRDCDTNDSYPPLTFYCSTKLFCPNFSFLATPRLCFLESCTKSFPLFPLSLPVDSLCYPLLPEFFPRFNKPPDVNIGVSLSIPCLLPHPVTLPTWEEFGRIAFHFFFPNIPALH